MNGIITPGKLAGEQDTFYQAENILEIVRHDDEQVYFRVRLHYYNGHMCGLSGMARREGSRFVFRSPEAAVEAGESCTLTITPSRAAITLKRPNQCDQRGHLSK